MNSRAFQQSEKKIAEKHQQAVEVAHAARPRMDFADRDRLILKHLPLVRHIAKCVHNRLPPNIVLNDLISSGILGLIDAINKFDSRRLVDLPIYAKYRIRGAILDSLRGLDWTPRLLRKRGRSLDELRERLTSKLHRAPAEAELAQEAGWDLKKLRRLEENLWRAELVTLRERPVSEEKWDGAAREPANDELSPYSLCYKREMRDLLRSSFSQLSDKERQVLVLYYYKELTMKEVGAVLGVGQAWVSKMHSAAVRKVRTYLKAREC